MQKEKSSRILFILNGSLFLLSAFSAVDDGKWLLVIVQALAGVLNLIMLALLSKGKLKYWNNLAILALNVVVCLAVAWDLYASGKTYIQYVWLLAAFFSAGAWVVFYRQQRGQL